VIDISFFLVGRPELFGKLCSLGFMVNVQIVVDLVFIFRSSRPFSDRFSLRPPAGKISRRIFLEPPDPILVIAVDIDENRFDLGMLVLLAVTRVKDRLVGLGLFNLIIN
jgi:hypothetical protein